MPHAISLALAVTLGLLLSGTTVASAQITSVEPVQLSITAQSSVVTPNGSLVMWLAVGERTPIRAEPDQYTLAATVFDPLRDEGGVDLQPAVPKARYEAFNLADLERNNNNRIRLELPISDGAQELEGAVVLTEAGVYPVTIDLSGPDGVVASTRTNLIRLPSDSDGDVGDGNDGDVSPIMGPVAFVLAVSANQGGSSRPNQTPEPEAEPGGLESKLTMDKAVEVLTALPELPIAVLLEAETLNQLVDDPAQAADLAEAIGERPLFVSPAVDLDPSALAEVGQSQIFQQAMQQSWARARTVGLEPDTAVTVVSRQLTLQGTQALAEAGIATAIDTSQSSAGNDIARSGNHRINLIRFEDDVSSGLRAGDTASLTANRALARLVLRYQTDRSPAVLLGDSPGVEQTNGLGVLLQWIDRLAEQGWARTAMANDIRPTTFRRLAERPNQNLGVHQQLLDDVDQLLASFTTMFDLGRTAGGQPAGQTTPNDYRRALRSALALNRTPQERHRALLLFSEDLAGEIEVLALPVAQPVTMAASVGEVPVVIESRAAGPRRVMLQFRSDKVLVEQDRQEVVLDPGISSIDVKVQARTLGSSQLQISIWTPDGQQMLASNQFQIRSTAVPGLGLLLSVVAVVLLLVWWYLDHQRSERRETAELDAVSVDLPLDSDTEWIDLDAEPASPSNPPQQPQRAEPVVAVTKHSVTVVMPDVESTGPGSP